MRSSTFKPNLIYLNHLSPLLLPYSEEHQWREIILLLFSGTRRCVDRRLEYRTHERRTRQGKNIFGS